VAKDVPALKARPRYALVLELMKARGGRRLGGGQCVGCCVRLWRREAGKEAGAALP